MNAIGIFIFLLIGSPIILGIVGIVMFFNTDEILKKRGKKLLLTGVILFLVEVLIGYSICSSMSFGGMH